MTFHDQLLKIVEDYRAAGQPWPATREQMAEWAVANGAVPAYKGYGCSLVCRTNFARHELGACERQEGQKRSEILCRARSRKRSAGHEMG